MNNDFATMILQLIMETPKTLENLVEEEIARQRIRDLALSLEERSKSKLHKLSHNPIIQLIVGALLTFLIGTVLTRYIEEEHRKKDEKVAKAEKQLEQQKQEHEKELERIQAKRQLGLAAIRQISELMYQRYTAAALLASALGRQTPIDELKVRKAQYDEAFIKWNNQIQNTQLTLRELTSARQFSPMEWYIEAGLTPHLIAVDKYLTKGYDARIQHIPWTYNEVYAKGEIDHCGDCCYAISNYLWVRTNFFASKEEHSDDAIKAAERELRERCPQKR